MFYVILCFHVVDNLLLIILVYHMCNLDVNNMFKIDVNYSKLGIRVYSSLNVFNWKLGFCYSGVIRVN